ncbi:hypothetical protein OH784_21785 [Ectobacillus funiculus]|uniref:glycoside hydrolase family 113 n=1 Tax=Ectobacillus funiculus TaxID=137993 RepID=UPI003978946A
MRRNMIILLSVIVLIGGVVLNSAKLFKKKHKGIAITLSDSIDTDDWYDQNLPKIKDIGGELQVVTAVTVQDKNDSSPLNDPKIRSKFERLFSKSKQYGVKVTIIKPHIMLPDFRDSFDRGTYAPKDINLFFNQWRDIILYYASVSAKNDVPILSITCETLILTQSTYIPQWKKIIDEVKSKYPELKLTMAFQKNELDREIRNHENGLNSISTSLDYISLNAYPIVNRLNKDNKVEVNDNLFAKTPGSYGFVESIQKANKYFHKEILITETGATPRSDTSKNYIRPINLDTTKPLDHVDQNQWVRIVLPIFLQMKEVEGVYIWHVNSPFQFLDSPTAVTIKELYRKY